jgi:hypothetical protein
MTSRLVFPAGLAGALLVAPAALAQQHGMDMGMAYPGFDLPILLGLLEIPFLAVALLYSWRTASALHGGIFGRGMGLIAAGTLVMGIGHLLMLAHTALGVDLLSVVFGGTLGGVFWVIALLASWGLTGIGFHSIYKASRA